MTREGRLCVVCVRSHPIHYSLFGGTACVLQGWVGIVFFFRSSKRTDIQEELQKGRKKNLHPNRRSEARCAPKETGVGCIGRSWLHGRRCRCYRCDISWRAHCSSFAFLFLPWHINEPKPFTNRTLRSPSPGSVHTRTYREVCTSSSRLISCTQQTHQAHLPSAAVAEVEAAAEDPPDSSRSRSLSASPCSLCSWILWPISRMYWSVCPNRYLSRRTCSNLEV